MIYEIEGELENPDTGEKLPFKARFNMTKDIHKSVEDKVIAKVLEILNERCDIYEENKLYEKMDVMVRVLCDIKEEFNYSIKDETDDKRDNEHKDGSTTRDQAV
jgi:hypothetical protein